MSIMRFLKYKTLLLAIVVFSIILSSVLSVQSRDVYAQGGVGSGGNGAGCLGNGTWCTSYGWTWAVYPIASGGPSDGFRSDAGAWSGAGGAQTTCSAAGAGAVLVHIIADSDFSARGYNYHTAQEAMSYHYPAGTQVDSGSASDIRAVTTAEAQTTFNNLVASGVDTRGLVFGVDVAWMCYDLPPPVVDVCNNIPGNQATIPLDRVSDGAGGCVYPDVCQNIPGVQTSPPPGTVDDGAGNCITPPPAINCPGVPNIIQPVTFVFPAAPANEGSTVDSSPPTETRYYYYVFGSTPTSLTHQISTITSRSGAQGVTISPGEVTTRILIMVRQVTELA